MANPLVFHVPVELGLKLMTPISANRVDAKRELLDDVVNESDGVCLIVLCVDFECPHARSIINGRVLEPPDALAIRGLEAQNLYICLDMVTGDFLRISMRMDRAPARLPGKSAQPMPSEGPVNACTGNVDAVVTSQVP